VQELVAEAVHRRLVDAQRFLEEGESAQLAGRRAAKPLAEQGAERLVDLALDHEDRKLAVDSAEHEEVVLRRPTSPRQIDLIFGNRQDRIEGLEGRAGEGVAQLEREIGHRRLPRLGQHLRGAAVLPVFLGIGEECLPAVRVMRELEVLSRSAQYQHERRVGGGGR
jgi:hypothetical protein